MSEKIQKVLSRLGNIWPKKLDDDGVVEWFAEYESLLRNYEPWVLDAATTRIIGSKKTPGFPLPREVIDACEQVLADDRRVKPRLDVGPDKANPYKLASELIQCELGRRAAREGWVLTLRDFVARNGRLPQGDIEIKKLIKIRDQFQQNLIDCIDGNGGLLGGPLSKLGRTMARREYEIAQRVLGPDAEDWYARRL
jgi:hypothetical protein